jgi:hypothetical protein
MLIHRNELHDYAQSLISRCYDKNDTYSWEDYNRDFDAIEFIPLDLSAYPQLSSEIITWINKLFTEETTDRNEKYMLRGFTRWEGVEMNKLGLTYGDGGDALSFYAYNDQEMLVYTYCEGDTTLKIFNDKAEYEAEKAENSNWYLNER